MAIHFKDRAEAGCLLGRVLQEYAGRDDLLVLALPKGGVPVGFELAKALRAPLDVLIIRKLGVPSRPELAMGAVTSGGILLTNLEVMLSLNVSEQTFHVVAERERERARRDELLYRGTRPPPDTHSRIVILVDDGLATGSTMRAALAATRLQEPARVIVAVPTGPALTCEVLKADADQVVCPSRPDPFRAISFSYDEFTQIDDDTVRGMIRKSDVALTRLREGQRYMQAADSRCPTHERIGSTEHQAQTGGTQWKSKSGSV
jgi:putative phosphoribosyl transferase